MSFFLAAILSVPALPTLPPLAIDPLAEELSRFPSREVAEFWWGWGWRYRDWLNANTPIGLVTRDELQTWKDYRNEISMRVDMWYNLMMAHNPDYAEVSRRRWLGELWILLGDDKFALGYMPPPFDLSCMWKR